MRSYVVKRLPHFKHSRRRRMESASLLSRESTTLSLANPQNGHFMALAGQTWSIFLRSSKASEQEKSPSELVPKIVTVDSNGNSGAGGTPAELANAKRRSHPLRYERLFSPKTSPVTEGLKFSTVAAVPQVLSNDLGRSFHYGLVTFVIRLFAICK